MRGINSVAIAAAFLFLSAAAFGQTTRPAREPATISYLDLSPRPVPPRKAGLPTLWIIGDSTVRNGEERGENGQWGWGTVIGHYFDGGTINVINYALGGTSSKTFMVPGRNLTSSLWDTLLNNFTPGDFVIMQFGHNDGGRLDDPARARATLPGNGEETQEIDNPVTGKHETVHTFGWYIRKYCTDAKAKDAAEVIVCSPIPRDNWAGGMVDASTQYPAWAEAAAKQAGADFLDLHKAVSEKYEAIGHAAVREAFFPDRETTHTDWAGAILNAETVCEGIKSIPDGKLAAYLLANPPAQILLQSGKAR